MLGAIRYGLSNLLNPSGRDARQTFWFLVLFFFILTIVISTAVSMPMTISTMKTAIELGMQQAANPDAAVSKEFIQGRVMASMSDYLPFIVWTSVVTSLGVMIGLAAAFVRRLHDSDLSGWWAVPPACLHAIKVAFIPSQLSKMNEMMVASTSGDPSASLAVMQNSMGPGAVAGWLAIIVVIVLGVRKSTDGPNRFGAESKRF
jgi:uncharacterized membrane protein YhaH (DUF805 family)